MVCKVGKCFVGSLFDSKWSVFCLSSIRMDASSGYTLDGRIYVMADLCHGSRT